MIHQPGSKVIDIVQGCITSDFELRFFYVHSPNFTLALAFSSNYRYRFNLFNRDVPLGLFGMFIINEKIT